MFFRHEARRQAYALGITGWVLNEPDGSVTIVGEGREDLLQKFVEWCRKGTEKAKVDSVELEWSESRGTFTGFEIK